MSRSAPPPEAAKPKQGGRSTWKVRAEEEGRRLDNALLTRLGLPRMALYRLIRIGAVRVNGGKVRPGHRLTAGDEISLPALRPAAEGEPPRPATEDEKAQLRSRLLGRARDCLVLDKPPGLAVQRGTAVRLSLIDLARATFTDCPWLELVHRLDKDTSGCLVLATSLAFARHFQQQLRRGEVRKEYQCLVRGRWDPGRDRLEGVLPRAPGRKRDKERWAATTVEVLEHFGDTATLVRAGLLTGRTHQLRLQFAEAGAPIAGDRRYGDARFDRRLKQLGLKRMFLHAARIEFADLSGRRKSFTAPQDSRLNAPLTTLRRAIQS